MIANRLLLCGLVGLAYATPIEGDRTATMAERATPASTPRRNASPVAREIDVATARKMFVQRYRRTFGDKYFRNPLNHEYYKLPDLEERALELVSKSDGWWSLAADGAIGLVVKGRVDLAGKWVDIEFVGVATE